MPRIPMTAAPAAPAAPTLTQQKSDFTAEGSPPPGQVSQRDAASPAPPSRPAPRPPAKRSGAVKHP